MFVGLQVHSYLSGGLQSTDSEIIGSFDLEKKVKKQKRFAV